MTTGTFAERQRRSAQVRAELHPYLNGLAELLTDGVANGMLTLLRHPELLRRLPREPDLIDPLVEELLRYEPPAQFLQSRTALADIDIAGTTIPEGSPVMLMLAAGNRDPTASRTPTASTPTAATTSTSTSAAACTTATAPPWPGPRRRSP